MSENASASGCIPTTGSIDTRIGRLEVRNSYPTDATAAKLFDEMDFQRAVQAYLWALPGFASRWKAGGAFSGRGIDMGWPFRCLRGRTARLRRAPWPSVARTRPG